MRVLIVDDEDNLRKTLAKYLSLESWEVEQASNGVSAKKILEERAFDAVVSDLRMPGVDGLELLDWISTDGPAVPVLMMSAFGEVGDAVRAMKSGASDYLVKPFDPEELVMRLKTVADRSSARIRSSRPGATEEKASMSRDPGMNAVVGLLDKAAPSDATILITGESGTGKEVAARYVHEKSPRSAGPFVAVNLGGLPETLIESELFGYEKGAFTGAESRKIGLFEAAVGGTLFLDEIGEMPGTLQVKLLRALQEKKIQRLGGIGVIPVDVRIIAATNRKLEEDVKDGRFREDLFYRVKVIEAHIPPLRERPADILFLANMFLENLKSQGRTSVSGFSGAALEALSAYSFPGNIRELENMVERAVILAEGSELRPVDLALSQTAAVTPGRTYAGTLEEMEVAMIKETLLRNDGHRERSAKELGITRKTLLNKIKSYDLDV